MENMARDWEARVLQRLYSAHYLNECLALTDWARQHECVLVRLPVVGGSRQSVNILVNVSVSLDHDDEVRLDGDQN